MKPLSFFLSKWARCEDPIACLKINSGSTTGLVREKISVYRKRALLVVPRKGCEFKMWKETILKSKWFWHSLCYSTIISPPLSLPRSLTHSFFLTISLYFSPPICLCLVSLQLIASSFSASPLSISFSYLSFILLQFFCRLFYMGHSDAFIDHPKPWYFSKTFIYNNEQEWCCLRS